jgi:hypothetical protein
VTGSGSVSVGMSGFRFRLLILSGMSGFVPVLMVVLQSVNVAVVPVTVLEVSPRTRPSRNLRRFGPHVVAFTTQSW